MQVHGFRLENDRVQEVVLGISTKNHSGSQKDGLERFKPGRRFIGFHNVLRRKQTRVGVASHGGSQTRNNKNNDAVKMVVAPSLRAVENGARDPQGAIFPAETRYTIGIALPSPPLGELAIGVLLYLGRFLWFDNHRNSEALLGHCARILLLFVQELYVSACRET